MIVNHPWRAIAIVACVVVVALVASIGITNRLSSKGIDAALDPGAESSIALKRIQKATGVDPAAQFVLLVKTGSPASSSAGRKEIEGVQRQLARDPDIAGVSGPFGLSGPFDGPDAGQKSPGSSDRNKTTIPLGPLSTSQRARLDDVVARYPIPAVVVLNGKPVALADVDKRVAKKIRAELGLPSPSALSGNAALISRDDRSALIVGYLKPGRAEGDSVERLRNAFHDNVVVGGSQVFASEMLSITLRDLLRAELIALPLMFLLTLLVFRSVFAAAMPLVVAGVAVPITLGLVSVFDAISDLSIFALNITLALGLGLSTDYALLMVTRFREELAAGCTTQEAIGVTYRTAGRSVGFSALTVAGASLTLLVFPIKMLYSTGVGIATVSAVSGASALLVLPAVLMLIGERIDRFSIPHRSIPKITARWRKFGQLVSRRRALTAVSALLVLGAFALPVSRVTFTTTDPGSLPAASPARAVDLAVNRDFGRSTSDLGLFVVVSAPRSEQPRVQAYTDQISKLDGIDSTSRPVFLGDNLWRIIVYPEGGTYSANARASVANVRAVKTDLPRWVSGESASFVDQKHAIASRAPIALFLLGLITFATVFWMTGSFVLPIKLFILNLITLAATFGLLVWIFQDGRLEGLLGFNSVGAIVEISLSALLVALAFGLTTDYGIFLIGRISEFHDAGYSNEDSVIEGVAAMGRVVTSAALLFCVVVSVFVTSQLVAVKELCLGAALAVAIDATIVRMLLLPAAMFLLGRFNWWAPQPFVRFRGRYQGHGSD